jgi:hypothetical protein
MPAMMRKRGKTTKIAYNILGIPLNMSKPTEEEKRIKKALAIDWMRYER